MKRQTKIVTLVASTIAIAGAFGYVFDRPVWYRAEFMPMAEVVTELAAESVSSKLQRAEEQKERREKRLEIDRARGRSISVEDQEDLRYWKGRVRELKRKLKKLDR